jgi:hypothetical protein
MKSIHLEVPYEGDHCIPCVYMVEVVEEAVRKFGPRVEWDKVHLKRAKGAKRFVELSVSLGRVAPVPSIFIEGQLVFDMIPPVEDLEACLEEALVGRINLL